MSKPAAGQRDCVLVVDDDEGIRESLREVVEMIGCSVLLAKNGAEALTLLAETRPCLIVVDLLMPVMSGAELLQVLRMRPELADLPLVVSTSAPEQAPQGVPVLPKPIDIAALWQRIRQSCQCGPPSVPLPV